MARYSTSLPSKTITGTTTIVTPDSGAFVQMSGTAPYTVTLPPPAAFPGSNFTFHNTTTGTNTLSTPSGAFIGTGGSGTASISLFASNVASVTSDGANYVVISEDGSALVATTAAFSGDVTINGGSATVAITPSILTIAPTSSSSINNVVIGNTTRAAGSFTSVAANNQVTVSAGIASSSTSTGSLVVTGGIGASGNIYSGGNVVATNLTGTLQTATQTNITSVGTLTSLTTGSLTATGNSALTTSTITKALSTTTDWDALTIANSGSWSTAIGKYASILFTDGTNRIASVGTTFDGSFGRLDFNSFYNGASGSNANVVMSVRGNNTVGIGTTTPGRQLTISRATETTSEQLEFRNEGGITTGNYGGIVWTQGAAGATTLSSIRLNYNSSGAPDMSFNLRNDSNVIFLRNGGNVGIGTTDFTYTNTDNSPIVGALTNNRLFVNGSIQLNNNNDGIVIGRSTGTFYRDEEIGFGWGGGWWMQDTTYLRVRNNKIIYSTGYAALSGTINTSSVGVNSASGNAIGSYVLGNGRWWQTGGGAQYLHFVLPARYNQNDSKMWCIEIKGYDFARPGIINIMIGGYVTPPSNGGPMSRVAVWDATGYYSPTAYYSSGYAAGVARIYFPDQYYASFTVNSIASGNGDVIAPDELRIIQSGSATI